MNQDIEAGEMSGGTPVRRDFLKTAGAAGMGVAMGMIANPGATSAQPAPGDEGKAADGTGTIPMRQFGRHADVQISALGMGGHHLGAVKTVEDAVSLVHEAVDSGITFYDNCWEYYNGRAENWLGRGLKGRRDKVFLMTKVCTHGRDAHLAMEMLEQSLVRLQTDHLDLWQIHGVVFDNDPELAYRKGGVLEALDQAKKQGKVRFVGFTGHKDPQVHLKMIQMGYPFDSVQMPLNPFDASFLSFEKEVLPEANRRGIAVLGMKSMGGAGDAISAGALTAEESLRYAMSLPVTTTISGMDSREVLQQNLLVARGFKPMTPDEMDELRKRCANPASDGHFELYKVSLKFDNPQARLTHDFPIDSQQKEVQQMLENASGATPH
jgi:aryl-alcohol dehydrogenase-like predicted oxidoreductase